MKKKSDIFDFVKSKFDEIEKFLGKKISIDCQIFDENDKIILSFSQFIK